MNSSNLSIPKGKSVSSRHHIAAYNYRVRVAEAPRARLRVNNVLPDVNHNTTDLSADIRHLNYCVDLVYDRDCMKKILAPEIRHVPLLLDE